MGCLKHINNRRFFKRLFDTYHTASEAADQKHRSENEIHFDWPSTVALLYRFLIELGDFGYVWGWRGVMVMV